MNVLVTGSSGFIGSNLLVKLSEENIPYQVLTNNESDQNIYAKLDESDFLFHLAGVNRPEKVEEFYSGNSGYLQKIGPVDPGEPPILNKWVPKKRGSPRLHAENHAQRLGIVLNG